ncbi:hypothetical protein ACQJBY_032232 [Aegilops geniculata]
MELQQARVPTLLAHEFLQQQQIVCVWYQPDKYYTNHVHGLAGDNGATRIRCREEDPTRMMATGRSHTSLAHSDWLH